MQQLERFDQFFVTIASETGGIHGLFESMFSFLLRRTDFYYESDPGDKMGFPPGVNVKIMFEIFQKYQSEHYRKYPKKDPQDYNKKLELIKQQQQLLKEQQLQIQKEQEIFKKQDIEQKYQQETEQIKQFENKQFYIQEQKIENKNIELQKKSDISTYNGGETEKYKWAQSITDLTIQIDLPQGTKSKNLKIDIQQKKIQVLLNEQVLIQGELQYQIKVEDSFWNIEDNCLLIMTLEKQGENIWKTIILGDKEIDTSKVDNSKHLNDFDDETQGALRKIMYEQDRKMKGLPTTEEEQQQELLRKAWDADGSPFKGTPFDPKSINLGNNNLL